MKLDQNRRIVLNALREALREIKLQFPDKAKPSTMATTLGIRIKFHTRGQDYALITNSFLSSPTTIRLPQKAVEAGSLNDFGEFCVAHELAHYFCWKKTGKLTCGYTKAEHQYFEIYAEAFAVVLTGNRSVAFVPKEDGGKYQGREASCRLTIAIVNLGKS